MKTIKRFIKSRLDAIFYALFPELRKAREQARETDRQLLGLRNDFQFLMDDCDARDPEFLKQWDTVNLTRNYRKSLGVAPDLESPKTFNEKLLWFNIHVRIPEMTLLADKCRMREYLSGKGYEGLFNELYGVYENSQAVIDDWDRLPDRFVLKPNHWSGRNVFVLDKQAFDKDTLYVLDEVLPLNYYYYFRRGEWGYKDIAPCIIAEEFFESFQEYKVFCLNGRGCYIMVVKSEGEQTRCFYDRDWNKQPFTIHFPLYPHDVPRPPVLEEMLRVADEIAKPYCQVRIDFYHSNGRLYLGEVTFCHFSGVGDFHPPEWDRILGDMIELSVPAAER